MNSRTQLVIDDDALLHNTQRVKFFIKDCTPPLKIIAMIKANAYGHGAKHVAKIIDSEVDVLGVACLEEGTALRAIIPKKPILLMGGVFSKEDWGRVFEGNFDVVIHSFWQIESLLAFCAEHAFEAHSIDVWLKINSGMHRLGFEKKEAIRAYEVLYACEYINKPLGIMTHFACADDIENPMTQKQIEQFESVVAMLPESFSLKRSLANSAGIMGWPNARQGYVRPGIMLYGISPFANKTGSDLGLKPVMSFLSHVFSIIDCEAEESVGYEAIWRATKKSRIAIIAAGYGDGYPRHVNSEAKVWINNAYYPIVGRVSMDMLAVDVSEGPLVQVGDVVELWGEHLPVEIVASFANTSPYELVTQARSRG
jgi:alanine racemase